MPNFMNTILAIFQLIISFGTVCTLLVAFVKFTQKPQQTQDERISVLEKKVVALEEKASDTYKHIQNIDEGNRIMQQALLAMLGHAINGEDVEELRKARQSLYDYLTNS